MEDGARVGECVGASAISVPLPPCCDSLHPSTLSAFGDAREIYATKVKQGRDTTGKNLIVLPMLACMHASKDHRHSVQ